MTDRPADTAVTPQADGQPNDAPDESVRDVLTRLYTDGRAFAAAEAGKQKAKAGIVAGGVRNAAIFGAVALMLVFAAIVALLVGLVLALAQHLAPLWATLIVVGGTLLVAVLLLLLAQGSITRMKRKIAP